MFTFPEVQTPSLSEYTAIVSSNPDSQKLWYINRLHTLAGRVAYKDTESDVSIMAKSVVAFETRQSAPIVNKHGNGRTYATSIKLSRLASYADDLDEHDDTRELVHALPLSAVVQVKERGSDEVSLPVLETVVSPPSILMSDEPGGKTYSVEPDTPEWERALQVFRYLQSYESELSF